MSRRVYSGAVCGLLAAWILPAGVSFAQAETKDATATVGIQAGATIDAATAKDWMKRWQANVLSDSRTRYCDKEMGEEIGWLCAPFLNAYYYGYMATGDRQWMDRLIDWGDSIIKRGVKEPDGCIGWPRAGGAAATGAIKEDYYKDDELGEAMFLRPLVLAAGEILKTPALKKDYGAKAEEYLRLSEQTFEKWDSRSAWRETKEGGVWVIPLFGIDRQTGKWTDGYEQRSKDGFSRPDNMQNFIAEWHLAMYDVTQKPIYRERAEKWFKVMKSRMRLRDNGKYFVWDYWDPAGPWDYKSDGSTKHWVGVHPNGGYYDCDVGGIVAAYEHGLVFTKEDVARLIATNRDFMWNKQFDHPSFQRIDGEKPDPDKTPGTLWGALAPYDPTLWKIFIAHYNPGSWGGMDAPEWIARFGPKPQAAQ
jgi:hypothetical protein